MFYLRRTQDDYRLRLSCLPYPYPPGTTSFSIAQSRVPLQSVLNLKSYNLERTLELLEQVRVVYVSIAYHVAKCFHITITYLLSMFD